MIAFKKNNPFIFNLPVRDHNPRHGRDGNEAAFLPRKLSLYEPRVFQWLDINTWNRLDKSGNLMANIGKLLFYKKR